MHLLRCLVLWSWLHSLYLLYRHQFSHSVSLVGGAVNMQVVWVFDFDIILQISKINLFTESPPDYNIVTLICLLVASNSSTYWRLAAMTKQIIEHGVTNDTGWRQLLTAISVLVHILVGLKNSNLLKYWLLEPGTFRCLLSAMFRYTTDELEIFMWSWVFFICALFFSSERLNSFGLWILQQRANITGTELDRNYFHCGLVSH